MKNLRKPWKLIALFAAVTIVVLFYSGRSRVAAQAPISITVESEFGTVDVGNGQSLRIKNANPAAVGAVVVTNAVANDGLGLILPVTGTIPPGGTNVADLGTAPFTFLKGSSTFTSNDVRVTTSTTLTVTNPLASLSCPLPLSTINIANSTTGETMAVINPQWRAIKITPQPPPVLIDALLEYCGVTTPGEYFGVRLGH